MSYNWLLNFSLGTWYKCRHENGLWYMSSNFLLIGGHNRQINPPPLSFWVFLPFLCLAEEMARTCIFVGGLHMQGLWEGLRIKIFPPLEVSNKWLTDIGLSISPVPHSSPDNTKDCILHHFQSLRTGLNSSPYGSPLYNIHFIICLSSLYFFASHLPMLPVLPEKLLALKSLSQSLFGGKPLIRHLIYMNCLMLMECSDCKLTL